MKFIRICCFVVMGCGVGSFYTKAQTVSNHPAYDSIPFIKQSENYIQYPDARMAASLYKKWQQSSDNRFVIAHFGDSHVQLDYFPAAVRKKLQALKGNGGRGMCFPFAMAKTYSHIDLASSVKGIWRTANSIESRPKIKLGVSGFAGATSSKQASVQLVFKETLGGGAGRIRVYGRNHGGTYTLSVTCGDKTQSILLRESSLKDSGFVDVAVDELKDTLLVSLQQEPPYAQDTFLLYGVSFEKKNGGVLYHNLGVGGADYSALITQAYFEDQIKSVNPDLVILDWGTNDIIYYNRLDDSLESTILKTIHRVRKAIPEACILLTSVQDMNYKGNNVTVCSAFNKLIQKIAVEQHCFYYDWFHVAGGNHSMKTWEKWALGRTDNIHLTAKGYRLKAELFSDALLETMNHIATHPADSRWMSEVGTDAPPPPVIIETSNDEKMVLKKPVSDKTQAAVTEKYYTVKVGDNLAAVAKKTKRSVDQLKKLNPNNHTTIKPGDRIRIQ